MRSSILWVSAYCLDSPVIYWKFLWYSYLGISNIFDILITQRIFVDNWFYWLVFIKLKKNTSLSISSLLLNNSNSLSQSTEVFFFTLIF